MSIQLEEGKVYTDRLGNVRGPLRRAELCVGDLPSPYLFTDGEGSTYTTDGHFYDDGVESDADLLAEFVPTETETFDELPEVKAPKLADKAGTATFDELPDVKASILAEAGKIVNGARRSAYGTPERNFERIARFWQAYFENTGRGDVKITAADVSPLMRLMKEARLCESPQHRDSFVDIVGYALTGAEVNGVPVSA